MDRFQRASIIINCVNKLIEKDSWCGETHLQKSIFFLQELLDVPTEYNYILYKHGPFSFTLRNDLTSLRADEYIEFRPKVFPYGPSISPTENGVDLLIRYKKTTKNYEDKIAFIANAFGQNGVNELEKLSTSLFLLKEHGQLEQQECAILLHNVKPHISIEEGIEAVQKIKSIIEEAITNFKLDFNYCFIQ